MWGNGFGGVVSQGAFATAFAASAASTLLAILLLVGGIIAFRPTHRGRPVLGTWALLQLPLAIAGLLGWWWMIGQLSNTGGPFGPETVLLQSIFAGVPWGLLITFALLVLIALTLKSVREYFSSARPA